MVEKSCHYLLCTCIFSLSLYLFSFLIFFSTATRFGMVKGDHRHMVCINYLPILLQFISMERRLLKWSRPGNRFESFTGIHPRDRNILFRGIWLRMARSGIASFLLVGSYYFAVDQLVSR